MQGERELGGEGSPAGDACRRREKGIREDPDVGFEGGGGGSEEEKAVASVGWRFGSGGMDPERDLVEWRRRWDKPPRN